MNNQHNWLFTKERYLYTVGVGLIVVGFLGREPQSSVWVIPVVVGALMTIVSICLYVRKAIKAKATKKTAPR